LRRWARRRPARHSRDPASVGDVITGTIKANFPTRISFQVTSKIDSRTILGEMGANNCSDRATCSIWRRRTHQRVHGPFVSDEEVEKCAPPQDAGQPEYLEAVRPKSRPTDGAVHSTAMGPMAAHLFSQRLRSSNAIARRRLLHSAPAANRLQPRRLTDGADELEVSSAANHAGKREFWLRRRVRDASRSRFYEQPSNQIRRNDFTEKRYLLCRKRDKMTKQQD